MKKELNTIYIELLVSAAFSDEIWMQGDIEIRIGDKKPYGESDIVNYKLLLESMNVDGEYFIFSCCCGVPECSSYTKGIQVTHESDIIHWYNPNSGESWSFDKKRIKSQLIIVKQEAEKYREFFKMKKIKYVGV